jgi:hypothetical protein
MSPLLHAEHRGSTLRATLVAFSMLLAGLASLPAEAQTMLPLPTYGSTYSGSVRGYWFQAPVSFMITGVRVPTDIGTTAQSIQIVRLTATPPAYAASTTAYTTLGLWTNVNTTTVIPCNILINANDIIAIFGVRGSSTNSYASTSGPYMSSVLGVPMTLTRILYQGASLPVVDISQESGAQLARVEIYYTAPFFGPNDAGIFSIDSPKDFCAGNHDVKVTLMNYGTNALNSATINWKINGVTQTPVQWNGFLDTLSQTTRTTQVTLGNRSFANGTPYTIQAWTSMANGVADTVLRNDSSSVTRQPALAGTFTIGGPSPNFATVTDAANALTANGVCGPVVLNVRTGVYNEQVTFGEIAGASATNTITLQSESANKNDVTLTFNASTTAYHTLLLNGTDWMRVRNMTIVGSNVSYGRVVSLLSGATNNVVENNNIYCATGSTSSGCTPIYMYNAANNDNRFENNDLRWGYYGSYLYGISSTSLNTGTKFINNRISDAYYYGLMSYYQDAPQIIGNTITSTNTTMYYGMYLYYNQNAMRLMNNRLIVTGTTGTHYGLYVYYCTATAGNEGRVANNFVHINRGTSTAYGLYVYYSNYQNVDFNTVNLTNTYSLSAPLYSYYGTYQRYQNNIFTNNGGGLAANYAYTSPYRGIDYNVYATTGATLAQWNGANQATLANLQTISAANVNSIVRPITYRDMPNGDLHLAGASQNDMTLIGVMQPEITADIDGDPRVLPYRGADEACYILPNTVTYRIVDTENQDVTYANIPGTINVNLNVAFPDMGFPITATVNFYTVPGNQLVYSTSFNATKLAGQTLNGTYVVTVPPTLVQGYYRINVVLTTQNSCGSYINYTPGDKGLLLVTQGNTPCVVWPGDVNNDGIANYGDRAALNKYIFDANLRASWLTGPARYRADAATNPMSYFTWEGQAGAPWATPEGCFMDADGNGMVNNFDLLPVKTNFLRTHGGFTPKNDNTSIAGTFGMTQNYPNPFNPTTTLQYAVPEKSTVAITVTDMVGRVVAVLVDGVVEAGMHTATFDASALESGVYMARYEATGITSGIASSRIVKMTLTK